MRATLLVAALSVGCGGGDVDAPLDAPAADAPGCAASAGWAAAPPVGGGAIQETAAVALAGRVYVIGGFDAVLGVVATVQIYDPATCAWSRGPDLPRPLHHANAAVVGDAIYVLGGLESLAFRATGDVWRWRPGSDAAWMARAPMPAGTERGAAVVGVIADDVYLAGGLRGGAAVADVTRYRAAADQWEAAPPLPSPRDHACGGAIGGQLYVAGGRAAEIAATTAAVAAYQPGGGWRDRAAMPTARGGAACGVISEQLIVVGGEGNPAAPSGVFPQAERYDPVADGWAELPPMPTPRHGMAGAVVDGRLYVPGGATREGFGASAVHDVLTP